MVLANPLSLERMPVSGPVQLQRLLPKYAQHSKLLGWILALVSVIVIGIGVYVGDGWGVFIGSVGASLMPVAIVNAWLDPLLREDAARDLRILFDVREDLVTTGFRGAVRSPLFRLSEFVGRTNELAMVPLNISEWINRDYETVLDLCSDRAVRVRVYISAPDEPWTSLLAHRENIEPEAIRKRLLGTPDQLLRAWDAATPHGDSSIEIFFYDGVASTGLTVCDSGIAVEIGSTVRDEEVKSPGQILWFERESEFGKWGYRQVAFDRIPQPPTSAGLRPLSPVPAVTPMDATSKAGDDRGRVATGFDHDGLGEGDSVGTE